MKKLLALVLVLMLTSALGLAQGVTLTMGSWRADDVEQMNSLLKTYQEMTGVEIVFQPTIANEYNATLRLQLENGTGPDLMYARSYATGQELYEAGYFADCSDIPGVQENFAASSLAPWQAEDGALFAVPFAAVSHAVYYNKDLFAEYGLEIPTTFEAFLDVCQTFKDNGITPLGNGVADEWDILECLFLGMLPNYVGGAEERVLYESGEKKLNDEAFVAAFTDLEKLAPYLPDGFEAVTYNDSANLFAIEMCAMYVDGSWSLGTFDDVTFDWGVFAIPAPEGSATMITFHPDMAITMNAASAYPEEAAAFLAWLATPEGATVASALLPTGFYPMINAPIELEDPHANEFLALNIGKETDARFVWPKLMDLYSPMNQEVIKVLKGEVTPQEAADALAALYP